MANMLNASVTLFMCLIQFLSIEAKLNLKNIEGIYEVKTFKKFLKTHKNVIVIFSKNDKSAFDTIRWTESVAKQMKGQGDIVFVNCGEDKESKKLCKKYKSNPSPLELKHFKDGNFHKLYDRKHTAMSMITFLRDPTGDTPWAEDTTAKDIVHVKSDDDFIRLRRKEKKGLLVMFYAPWCGHCKRLKPEFSGAASEVKGKVTLAGLDCDRPENAAAREEFNITGYPTLIYFEGGQRKFDYGGKYTKEGIVQWLENPHAPAAQSKDAEEEWKDQPSDVVHLTSGTFDATILNSSSALVMFYAPWCGHCKKMKPEYIEAAKRLKEENIDGILAAVDCTKEQSLAKRYDISGFPTVKYFSEGEFKFKMNERTADKIVDFMKDPKEPPPPPPPDQPWSETSQEILHVTDTNFKDSLKKRKHVLLMFYAPWCGHCKKAKPEYEKAAMEFADERKVTFAAVDCTENQATCGMFDVTGYPTFKYISYGKKSFAYKGGREAQDFIDFMKDPKEGPPPPPQEPAWSDSPSKVHHLTDNDFDSFLKEHKSVLVMFYAPWCGHCKAMKPAYEEAAEELHNKGATGVFAAVDCTKNSVLRERYEIKGFPTLKYFSNGEVKIKYESGRTKEKLVNFMLNPQSSVKPSVKDWSKESDDVIFLTSANFDDFAKDKSDMLVMFYAPWCGHCNKMKPVYFEAAKVLKKTMPQAVLAAVDCTVHAELSDKYRIKGYPTLKFFKFGKHVVDYESGRGIDDVLDFMKRKDKESGRGPVIDKYKWKDLPSSVIHLGGSEVDAALGKEDHALVMFHTSVCQLCKSVRSNYMRAASRISGKKFKLAAVDCEENSDYCKENKIVNFPLVRYYFKGHHIEDVTINESSSPEFFLSFLQQKAQKDEL